MAHMSPYPRLGSRSGTRARRGCGVTPEASLPAFSFAELVPRSAGGDEATGLDLGVGRRSTVSELFSVRTTGVGHTSAASRVASAVVADTTTHGVSRLSRHNRLRPLPEGLSTPPFQTVAPDTSQGLA